MTELSWLLAAYTVGIGIVIAAFKKFYMPSTDYSLTELPITTTDVPPEAQKQPVEPPPAPFTPNPPFPIKIVAWARSVQKWEGASPSSNNPGNLKYSTLTASWGATKGRPATDGGHFCQFLTSSAGFNALCTFLLLGAEGQLIISHPQPCTFQAFTERFAGNPPIGYIRGIAKDLGITPSTLISTLLT